MTETLDSTAPVAGADAAGSNAGNSSGNTSGKDAAPKKRSGGLNTMLIADLKAMASGMGIAGAGSMK